MPRRWLFACLLLAPAGCRFDEQGLSGGGQGGPIAFVDAAPGRPDAGVDAAPPDAEIACRDRDGDAPS